MRNFWDSVREPTVGILYVVVGWTIICTIGYLNSKIDDSTPWYWSVPFYMFASIMCYKLGKSLLYWLIKDK